MVTVGVVCAMESEAVHLRCRLEDARESPLVAWRRTRGRIAEMPVDLVVSGVGLINAAAATSALCALDRPQALLSYGCSGAHREDLGPGDVVVGERVVHCSAQIVLPTGERTYMGFDYHVADVRTQTEAIVADARLLSLARAAAERVALPPWPGSDEPPRIFTGTVASADVWTQHGESIRTLHELHGSLCEEMEAAAVAQVAAIHGVPFLAVKDISNNELREASTPVAGDWPLLAHVQDQIGLRAALVVEAVIAALSVSSARSR